MGSMNYIAPTLHFQQGDELCFQTSITHNTHQLQDMLVDNPREVQTDRRKRASAGAPIVDDAESLCSKKNKIIHRDVERQRRQEMSALYMSLRSQLPIEYLKGKRSISDHMNEAANYIKHLQKKIQELTEKRDRLRRVMLSSSNSKSPHPKGSLPSPHITVRTTLAGAAVTIMGLPEYVMPLSRVIAVLAEEGLNVIVASSYINAQWVYTIECENDDPRGVDLLVLQQKLNLHCI